jgi:hypothetical protein
MSKRQVFSVIPCFWWRWLEAREVSCTVDSFAVAPPNIVFEGTTRRRRRRRRTTGAIANEMNCK